MRIPPSAPKWSWVNLTACRAHLGQLDQARSALEETLRRQPELSAAGLEGGVFGPAVEFFLDGLRKAGWEG